MPPRSRASATRPPGAEARGVAGAAARRALCSLLLALVACAPSGVAVGARAAPPRSGSAPPGSSPGSARGAGAPLDDAALAAWLGRSPARGGVGANGARDAKGSRDASGSRSPHPSRAPSPRASHAVNASASAATIEAELARLLPIVARRRGLAVHPAPALDVVERAELVRRARRWLDEQTPPLQREARAALLATLELVPAGFSLDDALAPLLERELEAFYDPRARRIVIDRALAPERRRRALAHELVHALVDAEHGLGARLAALDTSDRRDALHSLAEGDAEALVAALERDAELPLAHLESTAGERSAREAPGAADGRPPAPLPAVIARSLAAPYVDGRAAARRLLDSGGFAAIDALYRRPLDGTHQLLAEGFPARLPAAAPPLPAPAPPEPGWTLRHDDVLGAQAWRSVLEEWLPAQSAAELARGWDGDRLLWLERGAARVLVWSVRTDPARSADVARAVSRALRLWPPGPDNSAPGATRRATRFACRAARDGAVVGRWIGEHVLSIASLTAAAQSVQCAQLSAWTIPAVRR